MKMTETPVAGGRVTTVAAGVAKPTRLTLIHPTRAYSMTRNPFAISAILPSLVVAFLALEVAILLNADPIVACGGFLVVTAGLLLIPALNQRGSLTLTHDGVLFERGKQTLTADWNHVAGLVERRDCGVCLEIVHPEMDVETIKAPGGLRAERKGQAQIPLRFFGDRRYSILYDIRDRLPEQRWMDVLTRASERTTDRIHFIYALVTAICVMALFTTMFAVTH